MENIRFNSKRHTWTSSLQKVNEPLGVFESLEMYCGLEIDVNNSTVIDLICKEDGGYLHWSKEIVRFLSKGGRLRGYRLKSEKVEMLSYLFELGYDLCLGKHDNVSSSPGFDKFLGQFGRGREN